MSPGKPARIIKVRVPRHKCKPVSAQLDAEIRELAKTQRVRVDTKQPSPGLSQAIESASDWNSLLTTARAERGPQWDVGTQLFHVERGSDLYYDPTPLFKFQKETRNHEPHTPERQSQPPPQSINLEPRYNPMSTPQHQHRVYASPSRPHHHHQQQQQHTPNPYASPTGHPYGHGHHGGPVPPQYHHPDAMQRMQGHMGMQHPDAMPMGEMVMGGGMTPMSMGGRRVTRHMGMMSDDGYMGM